jgi:hypothetical protein
MDIQEVEWGGGMEGIELALNRDSWRVYVNVAINLLAP